MRIGIFSGSFDPFTAAHYEIVQKILADKLVDNVIVMPAAAGCCGKDKDALFSWEDRRAILDAWYDGVYGVFVDCSEHDLASSGVNVENRQYVDMLDSVAARVKTLCKLPEGCSVELYTIIGNDSYLNFKTWHRWQDILDKSKLIVVSRGNSSVSEASDVPCISCSISEKFWNTSATEVRQRLRDEVDGMSMGPDVDALSLYLEEVEDYLRTGKTFKDHESEMEIFHAVLESEREKKRIASLSKKLEHISNVLADPYKDVDTKYSIVEDIMNGAI